MLCHLHLPEIFVRLCLSRHDLAAVNNGAAAHSQNEINLLLLCQFCALLHLRVGGIRHDAGEICHGLARVLQDRLQLVVDSVFLYGTAAVGQHYIFPISGNSFRQMLSRCSLAEINFCRVFIYKFLHDPHLLPDCYYRLFLLFIEETMCWSVKTCGFAEETFSLKKNLPLFQRQPNEPVHLVSHK